MATAIYSQPAAANFYTPHTTHHQQKPRGYRLCDHCGSVENPSVQKFRLCGGCMTTQYCSPDCQKAHWNSHKAICNHTSSQMASAKQSVGPSACDDMVTKELRKFSSLHQTLLGWAGFQALDLKRVPANIRQNALLIEVAPLKSSNPNCRFQIVGTHIVPRSYVTSRDPLVAADIARREDRCRSLGGLGAAIVLIQCGTVSQVMPVEVDAPSTITWDARKDWAETLNHFVKAGRADFKPISTSPQGIRYG